MTVGLVVFWCVSNNQFGRPCVMTHVSKRLIINVNKCHIISCNLTTLPRISMEKAIQLVVISCLNKKLRGNSHEFHKIRQTCDVKTACGMRGEIFTNVRLHKFEKRPKSVPTRSQTNKNDKPRNDEMKYSNEIMLANRLRIDDIRLYATTTTPDVSGWKKVNIFFCRGDNVLFNMGCTL